MNRAQVAIFATLTVLVLSLSGCGGDDAAPQTAPDDVQTSAVASGPVASQSSAPTASSAPAPSLKILGEPTAFTAGGAETVDITVTVNARACELAELLPILCRASTGAGGGFVVTSESTAQEPTDFTVVVRCGLAPAVAAAAARGGQPVIADLGLAPYGEVAGVTLIGADTAEAALVYQPEGEPCPVVWGLGAVDPDGFFTGGTDAVNGEESPIFFRDGTGTGTCAVADGKGGISVSPATDEQCP